YYHRGSPIGALFEKGLAGPSVGVIGLGAGSLAAYAHDGDRFDFYELDPEVVKIARGYFDFLSASKAQVSVVEGDARLTFSWERGLRGLLDELVRLARVPRGRGERERVVRDVGIDLDVRQLGGGDVLPALGVDQLLRKAQPQLLVALLSVDAQHRASGALLQKIHTRPAHHVNVA